MAFGLQPASQRGMHSMRASPQCLSHCPRQAWLHNRLVRRTRSRFRCWATIPVPDNQPVVPDLGWSTDFAQHYVKGKLIGQGSFGSVYLGIDLKTGQEVAIKVMPKQRGKLTRERTLQKLVKEVGILQKMQICRNAVRLLGCYESSDEVMVVTALCSGGDLQKLSDDHGALPERAVALIAYEVLQVVEKCHELGILHGDLKPANFVLADRTRNPLFSNDINLLFGKPWLLAIDFGCSQYLGPQRFTKRTGTPVYMAPEIFDRDYHWEADMWSLGIMLYQLYARRFPYWKTYEECRHAKLDEVALLVAESPLPMDYGPWRKMSPEGIDFMHGCLDRDYNQRMTVTQALNHPWLMQWLPEDDLIVLDEAGASLDSMATSSDEDLDEVYLHHSFQQQHQPPQQQQQQQLPQQQQQHRIRRHQVQQQQNQQQQPSLAQQQQQPQLAQQLQQQLLQRQQRQMADSSQQQQQQQPPPQLHTQQQHVVVPAHLGPSSERTSLSPGFGQGPGAYSSSSDTGGLGVQQQMQQQQHDGSNLPPDHHQQASAAAAAGNGSSVVNNVVPGGSRPMQQQQQQQEAAPAVTQKATGQQ